MSLLIDLHGKYLVFLNLLEASVGLAYNRLCVDDDVCQCEKAVYDWEFCLYSGSNQLRFTYVPDFRS